MPRGGARPGAGRKPRAEKFARPIADAEKRIADRLPFLVGQMMKLAEGCMGQPPDRAAIAYLLDRILGKAPQALEHAGEGGNSLRILVEYVDADPPEAPPGPADSDAGGEAI